MELTIVTNLEQVRSKYNVDEIKALFYSMIDSIYDILFNSDARMRSIDTYNNILDTLTGKSDLSFKSMMYIRYIMHRDIEAMNTHISHGEDLYELAYGMIYSYHRLAFAVIRRYTGSLSQGRLHPDIVATNGCKQAYLFVHDRHPKHKLNKSAKAEVEMVVDDIYRKEKNLGEV